jgi:hypothetical protein
VLIINCLGQIGVDLDLIIRVGCKEQYVSLKALVGWQLR